MGRGRTRLGRLGEEVAAAYLQQKGYLLLERRWRSRSGEIDLVMQDGDTRVFVEVRTRRAPVEQAAESVDDRKRRRLAALAQEYLSSSECPGNARIDVVCISWAADGLQTVEHIEGAVEVEFKP